MKLNMIKGAVLMVTCLAAFSCSKMNDVHQEYLDRGEQVYAARVDSMFVRPGNGRVRLDLYYAAQRIHSGIVSYSYRGEAKEIEVDFSANPKKMSFIVNDLAESDYTFTLITKDKYGNTGLATEASGRAYGDDYISALSSMRLASIAWNTAKRTYVIKWSALEANASTMKVKYTDITGNPKEVLLSLAEKENNIDDAQPESEFTYETGYSPTETMLDILYAKTVRTDKFPKQ